MHNEYPACTWHILLSLSLSKVRGKREEGRGKREEGRGKGGGGGGGIESYHSGSCVVISCGNGSNDSVTIRG